MQYAINIDNVYDTLPQDIKDIAKCIEIGNKYERKYDEDIDEEDSDFDDIFPPVPAQLWNMEQKKIDIAVYQNYKDVLQKLIAIYGDEDMHKCIKQFIDGYNTSHPWQKIITKQMEYYYIFWYMGNLVGVLKDTPIKTIKKDNICVICLGEGEQEFIDTVCGHNVCTECYKHSRDNFRCPICRAHYWIKYTQKDLFLAKCPEGFKLDTTSLYHFK